MARTLWESGSGKTGLTLVMVEEALRSGVPVLMIDVKGDLPNLLLRFPSLSVDALLPWVDNAPPSDARTPLERAQALAETHRQGLLGWDLTEAAVQAYVAGSDIRVLFKCTSLVLREPSGLVIDVLQASTEPVLVGSVPSGCSRTKRAIRVLLLNPRAAQYASKRSAANGWRKTLILQGFFADSGRPLNALSVA